MRRHWFFDFDGTLCDTEADIKRAWRAALRELGRDCPQFDAVYRTGPTLDQVTYMLFDDATPELVEQIRARFKPCYDQGGFPETKPYPWVPAWLAALKAKGCHLYVATNKRYSPMGALMRKMGWEDLFDGYYAFDMYAGEKLTKAALLAYTRTSAALFAETLRVNAVAPGPVLAPTDVHEKAGETLLGRPTPADVAQGVAYLLEAAATTGAVLPIDGGQHLLA